MNHGSLFSGIGGFELAAEWMGWNNCFHCEWNEFGQRVLKYYFPKSMSYADITKTDFTIWRDRIDILTGGFPCQPYSSAGKRLGKEDDRHLWPEMLRAIREIKPRWVVGENVRGLVNWNGGMVFDEVQADLEFEGYEVQPFLLPAASVGAPHQRERIWFVAYLYEISRKQLGERGGQNRKQGVAKVGCKNREFVQLVVDRTTSTTRWKKGTSVDTEPPMFSTAYGIPEGLDGITVRDWAEKSNEAYGNAVVPQVVYQIFKAIQDY